MSPRVETPALPAPSGTADLGDRDVGGRAVPGHDQIRLGVLNEFDRLRIGDRERRGWTPPDEPVCATDAETVS